MPQRHLDITGSWSAAHEGPLCAWRSDAITSNGRMRRATVSRESELIDSVTVTAVIGKDA